MIRVVLLGAGYVATHLAVGLERIKKGLIEPYGIPLAKYNLPYKIEDIEIVGVYDVDNAKVGRTMYELAKEVFGKDYPVPEELKSLVVKRGIHLNSTHGLPVSARGIEGGLGIDKAVSKLVSEWLNLRPDVIVNIITTEKGKHYNTADEFLADLRRGEVSASQAYAYAAAQYAAAAGSGTTFVNAIPTPIANSPGIVEIFEKSGAVIFGDDGATGATPLTADLLEHLAQRNRHVEFIVQFNIGGNTDFLALTYPERNKMKEVTKSSMVEDILGYSVPNFIKPTGYLEPLGDCKFVSLHLEYISFNGFRDSIYINARINDSPALAGILVDLIRLGKIAVDNGAKGTVYEVNAFFMKKPGPQNSKCIAKVHAYKLLLKWLGLDGA